MLATLIANIASGEALLALRRTKVALIVYAIVGALVLLGAAFLIGAAYLFAASRYGAIEAALGFGAGFVVLGVLVLVIFKLTTRSRRRRATERRKGEVATIAAATALAMLPALAGRKAGLSVLVAPILAMVGYQIYRENSRGRPKGDSDSD